MTYGWRVPGRIEVLGKHTDYAGGQVLVCAMDRGVTARIEPRDHAVVTARTDVFDDEAILAGDRHGLPEGHWSGYLAAVVDRLQKNFGPMPGCHLELTSDLPPASGMSSSSALLCATALTLADHAGFTTTPLWQEHCPTRFQLAGYLATVENGKSWGSLAGDRGVGTLGGSEDHVGMLCGRTGHLLQADFAAGAEIAHVPVGDDVAFIVAVSGVLAEKTGAAKEDYNRAAGAVHHLLADWNRTHPDCSQESLAGVVTSLVGADPSPDDLVGAALAPLRALAPTDYPRRRLEQFLQESFILVPSAASALWRGDWSAFGAIAHDSQHLAETRLDNQVPQTRRLVALAEELGALAASSFGAGFGGSVWALVPRRDAESFASMWLERYRHEYPDLTPTTIVTRPSAAAAPVECLGIDDA